MVCVMVMRNALLVCFLVFGMLCMGTILLSSASSDLISNDTLLNYNNKCIGTERLALLDIKQGLGGTYGNLSSWGSSKDEDNCCQWRFVGCDLNTAHVTHLHLSSLIYRNDYGESAASNISSSLLLLRNLEYLDLSGNAFDIPIPSFFGSLANLVHLDLSGSNFQGAIPDELGNLSKLSFLDLSDNYFDQGPIPQFIASLTSLTYLDLSANQFSGPIPLQLGNLSKLHHLDLSRNYYLETDSFGWLFHLSSLTYFDLSYGTVNSSDWVSLLYKLPSLSVLRLTGCQLDSIGAQSSSFANSSAPISVLQLGENQLDSSIFDWISNLNTSLVDLDLGDNKLQGNIPKSFSSMAALKNLDLSDNQLEGIVPTNSLFHIVTLKLKNNNFTSAIFDWVSNMSTTLIDLDLGDNMMQGHIPNGFGVMSAITYLDLSFNQLEGMLPNSFHNLSSLQTADFTHNNLSGNLQDLLYLLPEATLQKLLISENRLTGSLSDITAFSVLKELTVDSNQLNGYLPQEFKHKSVLRTVFVA